MIPPDMMSAAPPDPAAGGGMPPDMAGLMSALGGAGAPPEETTSASITDGSPGGGEEALTEALDLLQVAIDAEADQEDIQVMLQCQTKLQQILAKNQAEADKAMGGGASPAATRKMASAVGGY